MSSTLRFPEIACGAGSRASSRMQIGYTAARKAALAPRSPRRDGCTRRVWSFIHKLGSPRWCYQITTPWLPWLGAVSALLLVGGAVWGLAFAPPDFRQGNSYRIIFIHV